MDRALIFRSVAPLALATLVAACGDGDGDPTSGGGTPTPTPTTATSYSVTPCLNQTIPGTGGLTVAGAVVPDTLKINLAGASGFPNGRRLQDPVVDVTLAVIFLDLNVHSPATLANIPINPPANDRPFRTTFPYLAPPQGNPPLSGSDTATFSFLDKPRSAYVRVDRMGMPGVATVLIGSAMRPRYNDADPVDDASGEFVPELTAQLKGLADALVDDLQAAGLTPCAIPEA